MEQFDPASFTTAQLLQPSVMAALGALLVAIVALCVGGKFGKAFLLYLGVGLPIALIGYATGFLTGISRSAGAIGSLLPAVLALIGGVSVYAFGSDNRYRFVVGYCACLLIICLFYGTQRGAFEREFFREARLKNLFEMERRLQNYRMNRKLPDKAADWLPLGESA